MSMSTLTLPTDLGYFDTHYLFYSQAEGFAGLDTVGSDWQWRDDEAEADWLERIGFRYEALWSFGDPNHNCCRAFGHDPERTLHPHLTIFVGGLMAVTLRYAVAIDSENCTEYVFVVGRGDLMALRVKLAPFEMSRVKHPSFEATRIEVEP